jgi:superfamily II DNA or RNA helicase
MAKSGKFESSFSYKLIYIFRINDDNHKGLLKIGDATLKTDESIDQLPPNCKALNKAAKERINSYTNTAAISYDLLHTELAIRTDIKNGSISAFRDHNVHAVLENSGIKKVVVRDTKAREWFEVDLNTAIRAIAAVKKDKPSLNPSEKGKGFTPIVFRPEQDEAIRATIKEFKTGNRMLWNAKMRFGKTICALEVIRQMKFGKTIIITHRPVVDAGWYEDYEKIFHNEKDVIYGSKNNGYTIEKLLESEDRFIYFASIQDLRGSELVGGKHEKNDAVFNTKWDCVIVDEAHEGTTTALGEEVINAIVTEDTKFLALSGTPFNILGNYDNNVYTWDYIMEQRRKAEWDNEHFGDSTPYDELPKMNIFVYDLGKLLNNRYVELEDKAFNFHEFFRVWTGDIRKDFRPMPEDVHVGDFVHNNDVLSFLNLITKEDEDSQYPYSSKEYRDLFKHSLWIIPGIREAKALKKMMKNHPVFSFFDVVNVAGDGDEEEKSDSALNKVRKAIENAGDDGYTITLSCGKLTTGVTVKEWNAVFMLAGSFSTSASQYLQTIFRVQSPCNKNGKFKDNCYVFDFAPDRTLKMVAESVTLSTKAGKTTNSDRKILGEFLNYCPVISIEGTTMRKYEENKLLQQLKRAYAERAVQNGFDDNNLYNDELLKVDNVDLEEFNKLKGIIGKSKAQQKTKDIDLNNQGFTGEEYEELQKLEKKPPKQRTPEEQAKIDEMNEKKKNKNNAISILRGISIRMPLLIYGADIPIGEDFTLNMFLDDNIVDEASWTEFMPKGVTKEVFKQFMKYYDQDIFVAAGRRIRNTVLGADELDPTERVMQIAQLFACFKNPDKETVLTPWRVVNMHMSDCLGGYSFYEENPPINAHMLEQPRFVDRGQVTADTFSNTKAKILEINSKTGLYPLYVVYSIFRARCDNYSSDELTLEKQNELWEQTVHDNIFVICKTPMAKYITRRTLVGYKDAPVNAHYFDDLINTMQHKQKQFVDRVLKPSYWKREGNRMKFDAIVGNPPYQETIGESVSENASLSKQLFPSFIIASIASQTKYVSLITPSRWFTADAQDKSFVKLREYIRNNNHIKYICNYRNEKDVFSNVSIAGGVNYFLYDKDHNSDVEFTECNGDIRNAIKRPLFEDGLDIIISMNTIVSILNKVKDSPDFVSMITVTQGRNAFGIIGKQSELDSISQTEPFDNCYRVRCAHEQYRYVSGDKVTKNKELAQKWKVLTSKGNGGAGILNFEHAVAVIGKAYISSPLEVCTDSLIPIGCFDTEQEAIALQKYMSTKFLRFMVGVMKTSQNITQVVYRFVPLLDFSQESSIDWNVSISELDLQLYSKYGLTDEEIAFIESMIKPME